MTNLRKRDRSGTVRVVIGASKRDTSSSGVDDVKRASSDAGSSSSEGGGTMRAQHSRQSASATNTVRHHVLQRRTVRTGTPVASRSALARAVTSAIALARITTISAYTRRPKKRTDGGVARRLQPSWAQHRLSRRVHASAAGASAPPRGLRG
jgi:hypothetical protein